MQIRWSRFILVVMPITIVQLGLASPSGYHAFPNYDSNLEFYAGNGYFINYDLEALVDLSGIWKFRIGDQERWSSPVLNDENWEDIQVPSPWEDQGFPGYDGYAWYRCHFEMPDPMPQGTIFFYAGYVDDVDEVYVNGYLIGRTGSFPPFTEERDYILRRYIVPHAYLKPGGENVVAVRVFDNYLKGGIIRGKPGFYSIANEVLPNLDLRGKWKFHPGDDWDWALTSYDDSRWDEIEVPMLWEFQGYARLDGYAWYRKHFSLDPEHYDKHLILVLGRIDDLDETYLNGHRIGRMGKDRTDLDDYWRVHRAYYIPPEYLAEDGKNIIAVRVFDGKINGGFYEGPIGIMTRERYYHWKKAVDTDPAVYEPRTMTFWEFWRFLLKGGD